MAYNITVDINDIYCPISKCIFNDPVIAGDGHTYERTAIEKWIDDGHYSPITREYIEPSYYSNVFMKNAVCQILANNPELRPEQYVVSIDIHDIIGKIKIGTFDIGSIERYIITGFDDIDCENEDNKLLLDHPDILKIVKRIDIEQFDKKTTDGGRVIDWIIDECKNIDTAVYVIENTNYDLSDDKTILMGVVATHPEINKRICDCFMDKYYGIDVTKQAIQGGINYGSNLLGNLCGRKDSHELIHRIFSDNVNILKKKINCSKLLSVICESGSVENMQVFQKYGIDLNSVNYKGNSCIMRACKEKNIDVIRYLLDTCTNITKKDKKGKTVLHFASCILDVDYDLYKKINDKYHEEDLASIIKNSR